MKDIFIGDDSTLSPSQFHEKFKGKNEDEIELDLFKEISDDDLSPKKSLESLDKPAYRLIVPIDDIIKYPPKDHSELVSCFRERLHLQSHLKYTSIEEQKELADVLITAIIALWPQHRKQGANPFLSESGNKELQRRVAVHVIESLEQLFYDYVTKAEDWNSKMVFSSQANLSRLKTQLLHEAYRSLNVLHIRRKLAENLHKEEVWLKDPNKGYITKLLNVLDKWKKVTAECQSHDEYIRRQLRELKSMMPNLADHHIKGQLNELVHQVETIMKDREKESKVIETVDSETLRLKHQTCLNDVIKDVQDTVEDVDAALNRVIFKRCDSMPHLHDDIDMHEGFENLKEGFLQEKRRSSVSQVLINGVTSQGSDKKDKNSFVSPKDDLVRLVTRNHEVERATSSDDEFSPLLQAQQVHQKNQRKEKDLKKYREKLIEEERQQIENELKQKNSQLSSRHHQPDSLNIKVPGKNIVRICDVRVSDRKNVSSLTLDIHPTIYNEFLDEIDEETVKSLDHHLYAGAEIQEVYDEITKTFTKDFLDFDTDEYVEHCPDTCKNIQSLFMSGLLQDPKNVRYVNNNLRCTEQAPWTEFGDANEWRNEPKFAGIGREDMLKISNKAELRRSTFVNDQSNLGGVGQLAKNYAAWVAWYRNNVNLDDFKKFVSNKETDYLCQMHHLYDSDDGEEELVEAAKTSANLQKLREREEIRQKLLQEKYKFEKGFWNAQCINLGGLGREPSINLHKDTLNENLKELKETDEQPSFVYLQDRLEQIWKALKMPESNRLDMAIKHSSDPSLEKLIQVVETWGQVSELIAEREVLMASLESFERSASDPNRFFEKGPKGSSLVRLNESKVREKLHKNIRSFDDEISPLLAYIKKHFNDDVTYQGRNYTDKMQTDRTEMLYWLQQERREEKLEMQLQKNEVLKQIPSLVIGEEKNNRGHTEKITDNHGKL